MTVHEPPFLVCQFRGIRHALSGISPRLTLPRQEAGWRRWLRYLYLRLLRMQSSPEEIARGLAAGVFAGCFPIFGFQTLAALLLAVPPAGQQAGSGCRNLGEQPSYLCAHLCV